MDGNSSNDEDDDFVHDDEDLTWSVVSQAIGAEEPNYTTRGAKTPTSAKNDKGKGIASSSTYKKRYGPSPSHLELVDEENDIEGKEGVATTGIWSMRILNQSRALSTAVFISF